MKKIITSLSCILFTLSFFCMTGCRKSSDGAAQIQEFPKELSDQIKPDTKRNEYNFVIMSPLGMDSPVIKYRMDGKVCYMLVDTGCLDNWLIKKGIEKIFSGMTFPMDYVYPNKYVTGQVEGLEYILEAEVFSDVVPDEVDGILGLSWLWKNNRAVEQNDNVVFDYVNNKILFNQKPITEDSVSLVYDTFVSKYKIPFMFNDRELYGYLDTGCYCTSIGQRLDEEKDENGVYIVKDFAIGNVHYENNVLSNVREGRIVDSSKRFMTTNNIIGYPCFKDHIIQLDFKNNVFRIK